MITRAATIPITIPAIAPPLRELLDVEFEPLPCVVVLDLTPKSCASWGLEKSSLGLVQFADPLGLIKMVSTVVGMV